MDHESKRVKPSLGCRIFSLMYTALFILALVYLLNLTGLSWPFIIFSPLIFFSYFRPLVKIGALFNLNHGLPVLDKKRLFSYWLILWVVIWNTMFVAMFDFIALLYPLLFCIYIIPFINLPDPVEVKKKLQQANQPIESDGKNRGGADAANL